MKKIRLEHIPLEEWKDDLYWITSAKGEYSTKSGYRFLKNGDTSKGKPQQFWKELCKLKIWPKWKFFYWKLYNGVLATRVKLRRKKILSESLCPLCGKHEEYENHVFKNWEFAMRIWKSSTLGVIANQPKEMGIRDWSRNWLWFLMNQEDVEEIKVFEFMAIL